MSGLLDGNCNILDVNIRWVEYHACDKIHIPQSKHLSSAGDCMYCLKHFLVYKQYCGFFYLNKELASYQCRTCLHMLTSRNTVPDPSEGVVFLYLDLDSFLIAYKFYFFKGKTATLIQFHVRNNQFKFG